MRLLAFTCVLIVSASLAQAQHQPYAGLHARSIKALSEQEIADLRSGRGMGLALAAELNGYPGPIHVLELADQLQLSDAQRSAIQALYEAMRAEAVPIGETLIAQEAELDRQFASRIVTGESLARSIHAIAATQGVLRATHLKYHLSTAEALSPEQIRRYASLRGYGGHRGRGQH